MSILLPSSFFPTSRSYFNKEVESVPSEEQGQANDGSETETQISQPATSPNTPNVTPILSPTKRTWKASGR